MADRAMPSSFDDDSQYKETGFQKVSRKLREEPLIPLGALLTVLAVVNAWRAMRRGDHAQVQRMFRARIGAQAFTVMAMVAGGAYYGADREKRKELIKLEAQKRAEERHQKWLHELEVRDEEDKQLKAAMKRRQERVQQRRASEQEKAAKAAKAETAEPDAQGSAQEKKEEGSNVLSALSNAGGWFGTKKSDSPKASEENKAQAGGSEKKA
ncbi:mitochondrial hypoxia responsive domain-containing protein [Daldinia bambusicola]|nr:mitochondrial hypoxia responsive domain-containing protein [Daldinia bambusicola]